jgi:hypothetical protein
VNARAPCARWGLLAVNAMALFVHPGVGGSVGPFADRNQECLDRIGAGDPDHDRRAGQIRAPCRIAGIGDKEHQMRVPVIRLRSQVLLFRQHERHRARPGQHIRVRGNLRLGLGDHVGFGNPRQRPFRPFAEMRQHAFGRLGIETVGAANVRIPEHRIVEVRIP